MVLNIYTDGACRNNGSNPNIGAWAYLIINHYDKGSFSNNDGSNYAIGTTNNIMELTAIHKALLSLTIGELTDSDLIIHSDSAYTIGCLHTWIDGWKRNGWKKSNGDEILNIDLIKEIDALLRQAKSYRFIKVKGHSGDSFNDYVDRLCNIAMDEYLKSTN